eukprot:2688698-Rhodomonas_salina.1
MSHRTHTGSNCDTFCEPPDSYNLKILFDRSALGPVSGFPSHVCNLKLESSLPRPGSNTLIER